MSLVFANLRQFSHPTLQKPSNPSMASNSSLSYPCSQYYTFRYNRDSIKTLVTACSACVNRWISDTYLEYRHFLTANDNGLTGVIVGLDCESLPSSVPGITHPIAVLQPCINQRCLVFHIMYTDAMPVELVRFLSDENFIFIGAGVKQDAEKLMREYGLRVASSLDVADMAAKAFKDLEFRGMGLNEMAFALLKMKMKKRTLSGWDNKWLTYSHVEYACIEAYMSYFLGIYVICYEEAEEKEEERRTGRSIYETKTTITGNGDGNDVALLSQNSYAM